MDSVRTKKRRTCPTVGSSLIPMLNKLQETLAPLGRDLSEVSLPQVAVVGSQSSGKSSVLEALVGRDFLPRGCDICTRRPLILLLENSSELGDGDGEWGEFRHSPGKRFHDFTKIRREIQAETERGAGMNKGVLDKPIVLKISSPNVLNMTLVDLPGITKVPVGDQPSDIESRIRKMISVHIRKESCIILAVSPANSDLATSDALQMARDVDPKGLRTIGVITKLDIMDRGTDARKFLLGKVVPLRLGYIGVVNRCQEDINKNCSIIDALCKEEKFFHDHPVYNGISGCCGIPQLAKRINQILEGHIRMGLPSLKAQLKSERTAISKELQKYGKTVEPNVDKGGILLSILSNYCADFSAMVDGGSQGMLTKELVGGARIHYIFQKTFVKNLEEVDPCEDLTDDDIRMAIQNATGIKNSLFVPEGPFEVLVKRQINRFLEPSLQCLQYIYNELMKISRACEVAELKRFPVLRRRKNEIVERVFRDGVEPAKRMINNLIEMEMGYINTSHPNFLGGGKAVELAWHELRLQQDSTNVKNASAVEKGLSSRAVLPRISVTGASNQGSRPPSNDEKSLLSGGNLSLRTWGIPSIFGSRGSSVEKPACIRSLDEQIHSDCPPSTIQLKEPPPMLRPPETTEYQTIQIIVTKMLLQSYYDIVRKNVQDLVPKAIMHFLVNEAKRKLQNTMTQELYRPDLYEELLQEDAVVAVKRKHNLELFQVLQQAIEMLEEVDSDMSTLSSHSDVDIKDDWFQPCHPMLHSNSNGGCIKSLH